MCRWHIFRPWENPLIYGYIPKGCRRKSINRILTNEGFEELNAPVQRTGAFILFKTDPLRCGVSSSIAFSDSKPEFIQLADSTFGIGAELQIDRFPSAQGADGNRDLMPDI